MSHAACPSQRLTQAEHHFRLGEFQPVVHLLSPCLSSEDDCPREWALLGMAHYHLGAFAAALQVLEQASWRAPLDFEAQCRLAECAAEIGKRKLAAVVFGHLAQLPPPNQSMAETVAQGLRDSGRLDSAFDYCRAHCETFPHSAQLRTWAARLSRRAERRPEFRLASARRAHRLDPRNLSDRIAFAHCLFAVGRAAEAAELLEPVDLDDVDCVAALQRLQWLFLQLNDSASLHHSESRLEHLRYLRGSTYRPPKHDDF